LRQVSCTCPASIRKTKVAENSCRRPWLGVRELEAKVRELERLLGRKTIEAEILREALEQTRPKKLALRLPSPPPGGSR
jgi:hypothetical protein